MSELEFTVDQVTVEAARESVFVLSTRGYVSPGTRDRVKAYWDMVWRDAGREVPPGLLILEGGDSIKSLTGDDLRRLGLVRISDV